MPIANPNSIGLWISSSIDTADEPPNSISDPFCCHSSSWFGQTFRRTFFWTFDVQFVLIVGFCFSFLGSWKCSYFEIVLNVMKVYNFWWDLLNSTSFHNPSWFPINSKRGTEIRLGQYPLRLGSATHYKHLGKFANSLRWGIEACIRNETAYCSQKGLCT